MRGIDDDTLRDSLFELRKAGKIDEKKKEEEEEWIFLLLFLKFSSSLFEFSFKT